MTPERIAELKEQAVIKSFVPVESWELLDLLATVEREAKLMEVLDDAATELKLTLEVNDDMPLSLYGVRDDLFEALKEGGES